MSNDLTTVISGSFRKHLGHLYILRDELQLRRVDVFSPIGSGAVNEGEEFIILDQDPIADHRILQDAVFSKIRRSSFLTVANIDGYIGKTACLEIGYAVATGIQILTFEPVDDPNIAAYSRTLVDVFGTDLIETVKQRACHAHDR